MSYTIIIISAIYITIIIYVSIVLSKSAKHNEPFAARYALVDNYRNVKNAIQYDKELFHQMILSVRTKGYLDRYAIGALGLLKSDDIDLYVDPYIDYYVFKNKDTTNTTEYDSGIFICLTPIKMTPNNCIWNLQNKTIAYSYISDYLFIQALIRGYRQDVSKVKFIKINDEELQRGTKNFDMFFTYVVPDSDYMKLLQRSMYYISGMNDVDINRLKAFYPFLKEDYRNMREYFNDDTLKEYINDKNNALIPTMNYKIRSFASLQEVKETFITRFEKTEKQEKSLICQKNEDCPYFQANKNYPNRRGGCLKGFCELPVGTIKVGFTAYDDEGLNSPLCYDCKDTTDIACCKKKKKPDYIFADDTKDRDNYNMHTIVDTLDIDRY